MKRSQAGSSAAGMPLEVLDRALLWGEPVRTLQPCKLSGAARRIPSWSWCSTGPASRTCSWRMVALSVALRGRLFDNDDPSQPLSVKTPADYGIHLIKPRGAGGQYLHSVAQTASAASSTITGGQISPGKAGDDWDLIFGVGGKRVMHALSIPPAGVIAMFKDIISQENNSLPLTTCFVQADACPIAILTR